MKKILSLLLAVLMLVSVGGAWAEETTEEAAKYPGEITFQDIPWGSSAEEVKKWAKEKGFQKVTNVGPFISAFLDASGKYVKGRMSYANLNGDDRILFARDNTSFQIAGYLIDNLAFHFDVQNGKPELCTVVVYFQSPEFVSSLDTHEQAREQGKAILDDLEQKLITVYGEHSVSATDNFLSGYASLLASYSGISDGYQKVGAEDTAICLTNDMYGTILVYGKTDVYGTEEKNIPLLTIDSFNMNGL